jgi:hypothetical protein
MATIVVSPFQINYNVDFNGSALSSSVPAQGFTARNGGQGFGALTVNSARATFPSGDLAVLKTRFVIAGGPVEDYYVGNLTLYLANFNPANVLDANFARAARENRVVTLDISTPGSAGTMKVRL